MPRRPVTLTFREMTVDDIPAVLRLRVSTVENAVTPEELKRDYGITPATLAETMQISVRGWLCEDDSAVVGFAMGDKATGEVGVVAVLPTHEGYGIGGEVLARVRDWLFLEGHDRIWLRANPDPAVRASGFYEGLGWKPTGERINADHVLDLRRPGDSA